MKLNQVQKSASMPSPGIHCVIAGAGTGKTRVLVEKLKNIIQHGIVTTEEILVLTFSRKAASELRERICKHAGIEEDQISVHTYHSFAYRVLSDFSKVFLSLYGYAKFPAIIDEDDKNRIMNDYIKPNLVRYKGVPANVIMYYARSEQMKRARQRLNKPIRELQSMIEECRTFYSDYKVRECLIDYDDMIKFANRLLEESDDVRVAVVTRYRYILVDEFQDTSPDNFRMIKNIMPVKSGNLFIVGDDWQSIYGFRSANVDYMINVGSYFPDVKKYYLTINYRSRKEIIELSNSFIRHNRKRTRKKLISDKGEGGIVKYYNVKNGNDEVAIINRIIENEKYGEICILYRNNWQGDFIRDSLKRCEGKTVLCMTMHASKGLEFEVVIIAGLADAVIPDKCSPIEEERRLFYVALTRAKERLYIIHRLENGKNALFMSELRIRKWL